MSIWYKYRKLFLSTFELSACTFGGGFVIIPLMRKKFVEELGWIEEEEMLDLTAIAQASPGAIAVNASIMLGYHIAGIPGAILAVLGTVLPPLIIISIISMFYQAFRNNVIVSMAMRGMLCGVAAVICDVVINMAKSIFQKKTTATNYNNVGLIFSFTLLIYKYHYSYFFFCFLILFLYEFLRDTRYHNSTKRPTAIDHHIKYFSFSSWNKHLMNLIG